MSMEVSYTSETCFIAINNPDGEHLEYLVNKAEVFAVMANRWDSGEYCVTVYGQGNHVALYLSSEEQYIEFRNWCMRP